jgi:hypothetical protein
MKPGSIHIIIVGFLLFLCSCRKEDNGSTILGSILYGGSSNDYGSDIIRTADGGLALLSSVMSSDGDIPSNKGSYDFWLLKTDKDGAKTWEKSFGGLLYDWGNAIVQSSDGGFAMAGCTKSNDGDITGNHNPGTADACIIKTDGNGVAVWKFVWGGTAEDVATDILSTADGGFIVCGYTLSKDGDLPTSVSSSDGFILKLNPSGSKVWQTITGGISADGFNSLTETADGCYIAAGYTYSSDGAFSTNNGGYDGLLVKFDAAGKIKWQKLLGTIDNESFLSVTKTADDGFAAAGSFCNSSQLTNTYDMLLVKTDSAGNVDWERKPGGSSYDIATSVTTASDGNILLTGQTISTDLEPASIKGKYDIIAICIGPDGSLSWEKRCGGTENEYSSAIIEQSPGVFAVAGFSNSTDGDLRNNHGLADCWLLRLTQ